MNNSQYSKGNQEKGLTPITSPWMHDIMNHPKVVAELLLVD